MSHPVRFIISTGFAVFSIISACSPVAFAATNPAGSDLPAAATNTSTPTFTPTPQPFATPSVLGPDQADFPAGYNPLSGLPMEDPRLLEIPALLISVSHFPAIARPQAGLSFAPIVFEYYITEGATRFLAAFHGQYPQPEVTVKGDCEVRMEPFQQTAGLLGNRVWLDKNKDGRQEPYEPGVGGICVKLFDHSGELMQETTSDTNGYYGFNVDPGTYTVEFSLPDWLRFTQKDVGDENADSDADPDTGRAEVDVMSSLLYIDAGLIPLIESIPTPDPAVKVPKAEVGPVRSGRLIYADIAAFFQNSCLIYSFASEEVLEQIPQCSMVVHEDAGGGSMLALERMQAIAEENQRHTSSNFNYASNLFSDDPPTGGIPASQINVYVALLNQSGWTYDPLYQGWLRYVDNAEKETAGVLHADTDRLTGRQLYVDNFIVIFVDHDVVTPTNLDIHLEQGEEGPAMLFRNGRQYDIRWSTRSGEYEKRTGLRRPIQFLNEDGSPAALKPGHTWVFVATPYSVVREVATGIWKLRYYPPGEAK
jgi:hypothetical protein